MSSNEKISVKGARENNLKDVSVDVPKNKLVVGHDFMKYVAQEFDLMPYTSVSENIGNYLSNFYPTEKESRVKELIEVVELEGFENTKVQTYI